MFTIREWGSDSSLKELELSPEYKVFIDCLPYWRESFGENVDVSFLTAEKNNQIKAVFPIFSFNKDLRKFRDWTRYCSFIRDFLIFDEHPKKVLDALLGYLKSRQGLVSFKLPVDGIHYSILKELLSSYTFHVEEREVNELIIPLDSWENYLSSFNTKWKKSLRYETKKWKDLPFMIVSDREELLNIFEKIYDFSKQKWGNNIVSPQFFKFYFTFMKKNFDKTLVTYVLKDDEIISITASISFGDVVYELISVINPIYKDLAPGKSCLFHTLQYLFNSKFNAFNMGAELEYKRYWARQSKVYSQFYISND